MRYRVAHRRAATQSGLTQVLGIGQGLLVKVKNLFWIVVLGAAGLYAYEKVTSDSTVTVEPVAPAVVARSIEPEPDVEDRSWIKQRDAQPAAVATSSLKCDGRTSCPQMGSCAEATFFIQSCPNTAMDGDHDGIPCEDQWCR